MKIEVIITQLANNKIVQAVVLAVVMDAIMSINGENFNIFLIDKQCYFIL